jgi:hypothetical protein
MIITMRDIPINIPVCQTANNGTCGEAHGGFFSLRMMARGGETDENGPLEGN